MEKDEQALPVMEQEHGSVEDQSSCGPKIYVSNEEAALLSTMRSLRGRGLELRRRLEEVSDQVERTRLEAELGSLRDERKGLEARREAAFVRKMVMLGHLPAKALVEASGDEAEEPCGEPFGLGQRAG